jgi:hypothetical protein
MEKFLANAVVICEFWRLAVVRSHGNRYSLNSRNAVFATWFSLRSYKEDNLGNQSKLIFAREA